MRTTPATIHNTLTFILAGGQGERLSPLTTQRPKPAVSFGGFFRIIDFTLSNCLHSGLSRVNVVTQHLHRELHDYTRKGWSRFWNQQGTLLCLPPPSGKRYRGTADAIYQNLALVRLERPEFVVILSGDHVYHMDYAILIAQHSATNADITIATAPCPIADASQFGVVQADQQHRVAGFTEKPAAPRPIPSDPNTARISMGIYVFKTDVLVRCLENLCGEGNGHDFGHNVIPSLLPSGRVYAYDFVDDQSGKPLYWRDIGTLDGYFRASMDMTQDEPLFDPFFNETNSSKPTRHPNIDSAPTVQPFVHPTARLGWSVISSGAHIERDATLESCVVLPGARVGKGARLRRTIVDENMQIPAGFCAGFDADADRRQHTVTAGGVVVVHHSGELQQRPSVPRAKRHSFMPLVAASA